MTSSPHSAPTIQAFGLGVRRVLVSLRRIAWLAIGFASPYLIAPALGQDFLIGGYADGIYASHLDSDGRMSPPVRVADQPSPSFLAKHPHLPIVYAVTETTAKDPKHPAKVVAYRYPTQKLEPSSRLEKIGEQAIPGDHPCHIEVHSSGALLAIANYSSGSVTFFGVSSDGNLLPPAQSIQHQGSGPNKQRQEAAHAHCVHFDATGRWLLVADLGTDTVSVYEVDAAAKSIRTQATHSLSLPPGSGPRHVAIDPESKRLFVLNELLLTVTEADWNAATGSMTRRETYPTLPTGNPPQSSTAEIAIHPSLRYLYASNRGDNSISLFEIQSKSLAHRGNFTTHGKTPRHFAISPDGRFLLAENQDSHSIHAFAIDDTTGALQTTYQSIESPSPACILFLTPASHP